MDRASECDLLARDYVCVARVVSIVEQLVLSSFRDFFLDASGYFCLSVVMNRVPFSFFGLCFVTDNLTDYLC